MKFYSLTALNTYTEIYLQSSFCIQSCLLAICFIVQIMIGFISLCRSTGATKYYFNEEEQILLLILWSIVVHFQELYVFLMFITFLIQIAKFDLRYNDKLK